jgi:hypothetical protein
MLRFKLKTYQFTHSKLNTQTFLLVDYKLPLTHYYTSEVFFMFDYLIVGAGLAGSVIAED